MHTSVYQTAHTDRFDYVTLKADCANMLLLLQLDDYGYYTPLATMLHFIREYKEFRETAATMTTTTTTATNEGEEGRALEQFLSPLVSCFLSFVPATAAEGVEAGTMSTSSCLYHSSSSS
eukprot:COSAG05_NODE_7652_length_784_cov_0.906569_1_plen_120_part_00